jgi:hypothetical protein
MNRDLLIPRLQKVLPAVLGVSRTHLFGSSEFLQDAYLRVLVKRNLEVAAQACIDQRLDDLHRFRECAVNGLKG